VARRWHPIPTETLVAARDRLGWSREHAARQLSLSSKTLERYEKHGRVPVALLPLFAQVYELELEQPAPPPLTVPAAGAEAPAREILKLVQSGFQDLREGQDAIERRLARLEEGRVDEESRSGGDS
jgi:transcriptional regulator with XRE-family HTH domain